MTIVKNALAILDPHTLRGAWAIIILVIAVVVALGLALRIFFPIEGVDTSAYPPLDNDATLMLTAIRED